MNSVNLTVHEVAGKFQISTNLFKTFYFKKQFRYQNANIHFYNKILTLIFYHISLYDVHDDADPIQKHMIYCNENVQF